MIFPKLICRGQSAHLEEDNPTTQHYGRSGSRKDKDVPPLREISFTIRETTAESLRSSETIRTYESDGSSLHQQQPKQQHHHPKRFHRDTSAEAAIEATTSPQDNHLETDGDDDEEDLFEDETDYQSVSDHPANPTIRATRSSVPNRPKKKRTAKKKVNSAERVIQRYRTTHRECHTNNEENAQPQEPGQHAPTSSDSPLTMRRYRSDSLDTITLAMNAPESDDHYLPDMIETSITTTTSGKLKKSDSTSHLHPYPPSKSLSMEDLPLPSNSSSPPLRRGGIRRCHSDNSLVVSQQKKIIRIEAKVALSKRRQEEGKLLQVMDSNENDDISVMQEYILKKKKYDRKKGLFWQEDPTGSTWLHGERHW